MWEFSIVLLNVYFILIVISYVKHVVAYVNNRQKTFQTLMFVDIPISYELHFFLIVNKYITIIQGHNMDNNTICTINIIQGT